MELQGRSFIGFERGAGSAGVLHGIHATTGEQLAPPYQSATVQELDHAVSLASAAFPVYRALPALARADFLRRIASNLEDLGDQLVHRVMAESALPEARVRGERDRTCFQLRFFAGILEEGSWVDARIDTGDPNRKPLPKPDMRSMLRPLGPVAVFGASNFPLAYSVPGGDTGSALAGGNPVIVNAHFAHPGTSELCGSAIQAAARETKMPEGVFSLLFSTGHEIGQKLIAHPGIKAGGFTGSRRGGLALLKVAQSRPEPIPFYAEMSSVNPVFVLPNALQQRGEQLAAGFHASLNQGIGQFCTNPGITLVPRDGAGNGFVESVAAKLPAVQPGVMLNSGIFENYSRMTRARTADPRLRTIFAGSQPGGALPALFETDVPTFLKAPDLSEEVFGPSSVIVRYAGPDDLIAIARAMEGNLTATVHAGPGDEELSARLLAVLETRVGRILFQGFPTGLEVCQSTVHGGPFPSTSDSRTTSVGGRAMDRFMRPVCFQDAPENLVPGELRNANPANILRIINGERTRASVNP